MKAFYYSEDLLLLVASNCADGFELSFQSRLGPARASLRLTDPQIVTPNALAIPRSKVEGMYVLPSASNILIPHFLSAKLVDILRGGFIQSEIDALRCEFRSGNLALTAATVPNAVNLEARYRKAREREASESSRRLISSTLRYSQLSSDGMISRRNRGTKPVSSRTLAPRSAASLSGSTLRGEVRAPVLSIQQRYFEASYGL
jgi:hypothetical protein